MSESNSYESSVSANRHDEGCPECRGRVLTEGGERVCGECGLVVDEDRLDRGPITRHYDGRDDERERTGAPLTPTRHDRGLSTEIGRGVDGNNRPLGGRQRWRVSRMRRQHARSRFGSKAERNLSHGFTEINRVRSVMDLPRSVHDRACVVFREAQSANLLLGRSIESIAAGSVYAACRECGFVRTLAEVAQVAAVDIDGVDNGYRVLNRELDLATLPIQPSAHVPRFASALDLPECVRRRALELAEAGETAGITIGVQPSGFAAACIYQAGQEQGYPVTQAAVADIAETSPATLRGHRNSLRDLGMS